MPAANEGLGDGYSSSLSFIEDDPLPLQIPKKSCPRPFIPQRSTSLAACTLTRTKTCSAQSLRTLPDTPPDSDAENDETRQYWRGSTSSTGAGPSDSRPITPISPHRSEESGSSYIQPSLKKLATSPALRQLSHDHYSELSWHRSPTCEQGRLKNQRRCISAGTRLQHSLQAPDRFIPCRHVDYRTSELFKSTKSPKDLSQREKLLRSPEAINDPFEPPSLAKRKQRQDRFFSDEIAKRRAIYGWGRASNPSGLLDPFRDVSLAPLRGPSNGAVWNVGGPVTPAMSRLGPPCGIPNGRGGRTVSGSNAPYYTAAFINDKPSDHLDKEQQDARIAAALEINVASRIIYTSHPFQHGQTLRSSPFKVNPKVTVNQSNTKWQNGQWVRSGAQSGSYP